MITIPHAGAFVIGVIVGYFVFYFLRRMKKFSVKDYAGLLGAMFGGAGVTFVVKFMAGGTDADLIWYYPFGVFGGLVLYAIVAVILLFLAGGDNGPKGGGHKKAGRLQELAIKLKDILLVKPIEPGLTRD